MTATRVLLALALAAAPAAHGQLTQPGLKPLDPTGSTARAPTAAVPREGCVTAECHPGIKARPELHGPVRVNGCDACHELLDAAKHAYRPARDRNETCTLCHAPEVRPEAVTHVPFAKGECLACHDPHGSTNPRMLRGERYADSCSACHRDMTSHDRVHGPASIGACGACHEPHASSRPKLLNAEGRELCLKCHVRTGIEISTKSVVHAPVLGDCRVCHDPHSTDNPGLLIESTARLCTQCHQDVAHTMQTASTQHEAVTTKRACVNCHASHASDHASLLKDEPKNLCFECHNQAIPMPDGSKLINMKKLIESGKSLHGALSQRGCVECHEIHGGGHRRLLVNEYPSELYYPFSENSYALCFSCHDKQLAMQQRTAGATGFRNGEENLHFVHVNKDKKGRSCRTCHDAHAAGRDKHIRDDVPYGPGGWKLPIKYETLPEGGRCGGACHAPLEYNRVRPLVYPPRPASGAWKGEDLIPGTRADLPDPSKADPAKTEPPKTESPRNQDPRK